MNSHIKAHWIRVIFVKANTFSPIFFKSVAMGKNVKESFAEAVIQTEIFTDKGDQGSVNAPPY